MQKVLIVVDMQNDFINGTLGTAEAVAIVPKVAEKIRNFEGRVIFTRDTHEVDYLATREGGDLPVEHCIRGTVGWEITPALKDLCGEVVDKETFGSVQLGELLRRADVESITMVGLCTDICVISNALLLRAFLPQVPITVDAACCAGVTPESHKTALKAMKACQIRIENEE